MKWFFALNDSSPAFDYYAGMVQVAVLTARKHTTLEPVFIYDGSENRLTDWLADRQVRLVPARHARKRRGPVDRARRLPAGGGAGHRAGAGLAGPARALHRLRRDVHAAI